MYWHISGKLCNPEQIELMPDHGINLTLNLGEDLTAFDFDATIKNEGLYMSGPIMFTNTQMPGKELMICGVRFKPGGFPFFHKYDALYESANLFHEFSTKDFPDIKKITADFAANLDQFYLNRLSLPKFSVLNIVSDIIQNLGTFKVESLSKRHFITERSLERQFKQHIGLSPKAFLETERFLKAFVLMQNNPQKRIADIAWDCGYYDHAHLSKAFKRFTGKPPTDFILSDLSKEVADTYL